MALYNNLRASQQHLDPPYADDAQLAAFNTQPGDTLKVGNQSTS